MSVPRVEQYRQIARSRSIPMQTKNLPTITPWYWAAILAASMCGANTGDFVAHKLHLGHVIGLLPLAVVFFLILGLERRAKKATEAYYWLAVIVIRTAATNLGDLLSHDLRFSYSLVLPALTSLLVLIMVTDKIVSLHSANGAPTRLSGAYLPATNRIYWLTLLVAGVLGTAAGDFVNSYSGLIYGSAVLGAGYLVVLLASMRMRGSEKTWYWVNIVMARTAGTTMGDLVARRLGLSIGTACTGLLLAGIVALSKNMRAEESSRRATPQSAGPGQR
jgi:uncharacterized membrane-anchored protein